MILAAPVVLLPFGFERRGFSGPYEWVLVSLGILAFLVVFGVALVSWQRRMPFVWIIVPLAWLCAAFSPYVYSSVVFMICAAALLPWAVYGHRALIIRYTVLLLAVMATIGWRIEDSLHRNLYWVVAPVVCIACAVFFTWVVRTCLRIDQLAKRAERERIARDLHDVLGHTLTLIALKTELAGRLLSRNFNATRALGELAEIEAISRQALADVQQTILGDRPETLEEELERARKTLRTAGIAVELQRQPLCIDSVRESILGFALREAVTNVVRHAAASRCQILLQESGQGCVLEVKDNGRGGVENEGQGLRGMRERVEALGGSVSRDASTGTRLLVRLPGELVTT